MNHPVGLSDQFKGNRDDLEAFRRLIASPMRSPQRDEALAEWSDYKLKRQVEHVRSRNRRPRGEGGRWTKGDYMRALTARAVDLRGARFSDVCVGYADFRGVMLDEARFELDSLAWMAFKGANFQHASLRCTRFESARLMDADFRYADLGGAWLEGADLSGANLAYADLGNAHLAGANLEKASLVGANLRGTDLCGARVYGVSAWDVKLDEDEALRRDLVVTPEEQPTVTADSIEVAQFVYLLLSNPKIRDVIDTVCRKGVLILGRFTPERKPILNALRDALRQRGYIPMIFDFDKPSQRDFTETVRTLAGMAQFIIADITNPRSSPLELQAVVPDYMVPLVPILAEGEAPFAMFADLWKKHDWVLDPLTYPSMEVLLQVLEPAIIERVMRKQAELMERRASELITLDASTFLKR